MTAQEYSQHYATLHFRVLRLLRDGTHQDEELAEEISQRVWLRVWRYRDSFDPSKAPAKSWIYQTARLEMARHYRSEKQRRTQSADWQDIELTDDQSNRNAECTEANDRLSRLRDVLPTELHPILDAWLASSTDSDIAQALSIPTGSVAYHKNRVREFASRMG